MYEKMSKTRIFKNRYSFEVERYFIQVLIRQFWSYLSCCVNAKVLLKKLINVNENLKQDARHKILSAFRSFCIRYDIVTGSSLIVVWFTRTKGSFYLTADPMSLRLWPHNMQYFKLKMTWYPRTSIFCEVFFIIRQISLVQKQMEFGLVMMKCAKFLKKGVYLR